MGVSRADPPLPNAWARAWLTALAGRTEALSAQGAAYLVMIPPNKESVYPEFAPAWYAGPSPRRASWRLAQLAQQTEPGHVLHLQDPVLAVKAAGMPAFSRHDNHWTGQAAYGGYVALMRRLKALGAVRDDPRPLADFVLSKAEKPRDFALMLGVASFVPVRYDAFEDPPTQARLKTTFLSARTAWTAPQVIDTGERGKPVLLMTRDSFSNALMPYLYKHFSRLILTHIDDGKWRPDLVARYHPDIVILETQENGAQHLMEQAPPASAAAKARIEAALKASPS